MNYEDKLLNYAKENGISIELEPKLSNFGKTAMYVELYGNKIILLSNEYYKLDLFQRIEILAEELGHYATTVGNTFKLHKTYSEKLEHDIVEHKALQWACKFLVDEAKLKKALKKALTTEELEQLLGLPISIINNYLTFLSKKTNIFKIENNKALDLTKLPSWVTIAL